MIPMAPLEVLLKRPCTHSSNMQNLIPRVQKRSASSLIEKLVLVGKSRY
jgi:hypothetical protein